MIIKVLNGDCACNGLRTVAINRFDSDKNHRRSLTIYSLCLAVKLSQKVMSKIKEIIVSKKDNNFVEYSNVKIEDFEGNYEEKAIAYSFVMDLLRKLMGKTLTIIDASIGETKQNKSIKDLIRGVYNEQLGFTAERVFNQEMMQEDLPKSINPDIRTYEVEEVLGVE